MWGPFRRSDLGTHVKRDEETHHDLLFHGLGGCPLITRNTVVGVLDPSSVGCLGFWLACCVVTNPGMTTKQVMSQVVRPLRPRFGGIC